MAIAAVDDEGVDDCLILVVCVSVLSSVLHHKVTFSLNAPIWVFLDRRLPSWIFNFRSRSIIPDCLLENILLVVDC